MKRLLPVFVLGLSSLAVEAGAVSFLGLGDLEGGEVFSEAWGISGDGRVVVGQSNRLYPVSGEAFRWTAAEGMVSLGDLPGGAFDSVAFAASADGSLIVGVGDHEGKTEAFVWDAGLGGMVGLGVLAGGHTHSQALGISPSGDVIVGSSGGASGYEAFAWTPVSGIVGLGDLAGGTFQSEANAVSADGLTVVGHSVSGNGPSEAFRWTQAEGMVGLGDFPGGPFESGAHAVSADGTVVVGWGKPGTPYLAGNPQAFRWTASGGMIGLGDLVGGSFYSEAMDVSSDGSIVVGRSVSAVDSEAFIWDAESGMRSVRLLLEEHGLDLVGWQLAWATGISDDGTRIIGNGVNPDGHAEAWIVTVPEPSGILLLIVGLGAVCGAATARDGAEK